jgi:hypothetical protein
MNGRPSRRIGPKQTRGLQRIAHLATGAAIAAYVYLTPEPGSVAQLLVRWLVVPALIASGVAMWQWPRVRRLIRRRAVRP